VRIVLSGVSSQRYTYARNARNVIDVTKWRHQWIGHSQPPATTAYAAGMLPSSGRHGRNYWNLICIIKLHNN